MKKQNKNKQQNSLVAPLTPKTVRKVIRSEANLEFNPIKRQIQGEKRGSLQQQKNIKSWFNQYGKQTAGLANQTQAAYTQAGGALNATLAQLGQQDAANRSTLDAQDAASAAQRGAFTDTTAAQRGVEAANQRGITGAGMAANIANQGANQYAYLKDQQRVGAGESISQRIAERRRRQTMDQDLRELAQKRGDFGVKTLNDLRQQERDYSIQLKAFNTPSQYDKTVRAQTNAGLVENARTTAATNLQSKLGYKGDVKKANSYGNLPGGKNSGGGKSKGGDDKKSRQYASSLLVTEMAKTKDPTGWLEQHRGAVVAELSTRGGISHATANQIINRYLKSRKGNGGTDLNPFG